MIDAALADAVEAHYGPLLDDEEPAIEDFMDEAEEVILRTPSTAHLLLDRLHEVARGEPVSAERLAAVVADPTIATDSELVVALVAGPADRLSLLQAELQARARMQFRQDILFVAADLHADEMREIERATAPVDDDD